MQLSGQQNLVDSIGSHPHSHLGQTQPHLLSLKLAT